MTAKKTKPAEKPAAITLEEIEQYILDAGSDHLPTFGGTFEGGIQCQQVADELAPCILAILESGESVKSYLEIGVAAGGSTFLMDHFFKPERIVLIDDNRHPKAHIRPYILRDISREEVIGNSRDVYPMISGLFNIILIDGDHSYEGVNSDLKNYSPMLRLGGFLIFHDSALQDWGVAKVVAELKVDTEFEFIGEYIGAEGPVCGVALFRKAATNENQ